MRTTIAFAVALSIGPVQGGQLTLANPTLTNGILGSPRVDSKFLPGDSLVLQFDIQGVKTDETGKVMYSVGLEVMDGKGKSMFKKDPQDRETTNSLGGNSLPGFATVQIGTEDLPGNYTLKVTVIDRATKASQTIAQAYEVLPKGFGLVRAFTSQDPEGRFPSPFHGTGETVWVNFHAIGFSRAATGQPNIGVSLQVLDNAGRPAGARPYIGEVNKDVPTAAISIPMQFMLELNRPGEFTVVVSATDNASGKTATFRVPLRVQNTVRPRSGPG